MHDQEASYLYSGPFTLREAAFCTDSKDLLQRLLACVLHAAALNTDPNSCPPEVRPHLMKTIYRSEVLQPCSQVLPLLIGERKFHLSLLKTRGTCKQDYYTLS